MSIEKKLLILFKTIKDLFCYSLVETRGKKHHELSGTYCVTQVELYFNYFNYVLPLRKIKNVLLRYKRN